MPHRRRQAIFQAAKRAFNAPKVERFTTAKQSKGYCKTA